MAVPVILDAQGRPLAPVPRAAPAPLRRRAGLSGDFRSAFPYDAASWYASETEGWQPQINSADHEINWHRDRIVARVRDLVRNDGWASGAITRILDNVIGSEYRLASKPDYRALAFAGGAAFDAEWASEFARAVEAKWRGYADDPARYCDSTRRLTLSQMYRLALRHKLVDGEILGTAEWFPERVGYGCAKYATALHLIDPDRLSNPNQMVDTLERRGGVEIDKAGVPIAYHIRRAHQNDWYAAAESMTWDRVPRETWWSRPIVLHDLDIERAENQHRGLGVFVPVVNRLKMMTKYDQVELQAAVVAAVFSMVVESPYDPEGLREAMSDGAIDDLKWYWEQRAGLTEKRPLAVDGARLLHMFPGETVKGLAAERPAQNYGPFMGSMLRHLSAQLGTSAEQITQDWSQTNYSSARAALLEAWKTVVRRRMDFNKGFASPFYGCWLEEEMDDGDLPLPRNAPDFVEMRAAYMRCTWLGPGRGWVDPVKEAQGAVLRMDAGLGTLEGESAEATGADWEENLDQRGREVARYKELGLPLPTWAEGVPKPAAGAEGGASEAAQRPPRPQPQ